MVYEIIPESFPSDSIFLPEATAAALGVENKQKVTLSYGKRKQPITINILPSIKENKIIVSETIIHHLLLDTQVKYELIFSNNEMIIGPVIGLLLGKTEERLERHLENYLIYTLLYEQINGVLFVFCEETIDFANETISGYIYDPASERNWRKAELPFPGAIFRRVELSQNTLNGLKEKMGRGFFNGQYFDKWQFWNWLSPYEELRRHLAETTIKVTIENVDQFIENYNGVYLKPKSGSRGNGIYYVEKSENDYIIIQNYDTTKRQLTPEQMVSFLKKHYFYILQQPIRLHTFENRKVDYRVILQKNRSGFWHCTGIIARFGNIHSISSNFKANGYAMEGTMALMEQFGFDQLAAFKKCQEITSICTKIARRVEEIGGSYADLGIDVGIDKEDKIWVIEINKRPDHDFPLVIKDRKMYYSVKSNPVLYAKYLALGGQ